MPVINSNRTVVMMRRWIDGLDGSDGTWQRWLMSDASSGIQWRWLELIKYRFISHEATWRQSVSFNSPIKADT